jgi:hypothetical protein
MSRFVIQELENKGGWLEEYRCGCVSEYVERKRDLLGYCKHHGEDRRMCMKMPPAKGKHISLSLPLR